MILPYEPIMFQKLYRHLEDINNNLSSNQEKISRQIEMEIAGNRYRLIPDRQRQDAVAQITRLDSITRTYFIMRLGFSK